LQRGAQTYFLLKTSSWRKEMMMMINGHPCAPNRTLKSLCHLGDGEISGGSSLKFSLMKLEKKLMFGISFQQPLMSSMKFVQT